MNLADRGRLCVKDGLTNVDTHSELQLPKVACHKVAFRSNKVKFISEERQGNTVSDMQKIQNIDATAGQDRYSNTQGSKVKVVEPVMTTI